MQQADGVGVAFPTELMMMSGDGWPSGERVDQPLSDSDLAVLDELLRRDERE